MTLFDNSSSLALYSQKLCPIFVSSMQNLSEIYKKVKAHD